MQEEIESRKTLSTAVTINSPAELIRTAVAGRADLQQLKELLAIQKDYEANEAKKAYHKAMAAFKGDLPRIIKDKKVSYTAGGGQVKYSHASLFNVMDSLNPVLSKYGLSAAWFQKQTEKELTVTCRITHELGYSEETSLTGPHDNTGSKNALQAIGSSNAYLERYTVLALLGIATKDQDDDAQASGAPVEYISDKERSQIVDCLTVLKRTEKSFRALMKIESLEKLPKAKFANAMSIIKLEANRAGVKLC